MSETCPAFFTIVLFLLRVCVSKHLEPISWVKRTDHLIAMPSFLLSSNSVCVCVCVSSISLVKDLVKELRACATIKSVVVSLVRGDQTLPAMNE